MYEKQLKIQIPMNMKPIKLLEAFGGIGACTKAFKRVGIPFEVVDYIEKDEAAVRSYNAINGTNFEPQDITKWNKDIKVDFIMHGSPCTSVSTAGKGKGADEGSGEPSALMYESLRIINKLKPKYVVWENVKNLLSEKHIHNFKYYLDTMEEIGYNNYYQVLDAQDYGIPQHRERIFTVSIRKDIDKKKLKFKSKQLLVTTLKDLLEEKVDEKYYLSDDKIASISQWKAYQKPFEQVLGNNSISPTLTARGAGEEHAGMITYSENFDNTTNIQELLDDGIINYKGKEEKLPAICASRGRDPETLSSRSTAEHLKQTIEINTNGISNCLTTVSKDNYVLEKNRKQQLCDYMIENNLVEPYDVINHGYTDHGFKSIEAGKDIVMSKNIAPTVTTRPDELGVAVNSETSKTTEISKLRIRKLTPRECWRLMGFDDEDFEKASKVNSNSALYKQAGNSIVVNVLEAVLKSIFEMDRNLIFKFPSKKMLTRSYKDYLQEDYNPNEVVLTENEIKKVKGHNGCEVKYGFGGHILGNGENIYPTITASYGKASGNSGKIQCKEGYRILTPRESWRLMGFDDEDFNKAAKVNSSAQLYKQAGNSIVVNVLEEVLRNMFDENKKDYEYRVYNQQMVTDNIVKALLSKKEVDEEKDIAGIKFWTSNCSFTLEIKNYSKFKNCTTKIKYENGLVNQIAVKILEIAIINLSEQNIAKNTKQLDIDITEIIEMLDKNAADKDYVKQQIRYAIRVLKNIKITFKSGPIGDYLNDIDISKKTTKIVEDKLRFVFSDELNKILRTGTKIFFPLDILQFNEKYDPNFYLIYKKLLSSIGTENNATIKVIDLYKYCVTLPSIEHIKSKNRAFSERIRVPMEKTLNSISEFEWEYENKNEMTFNEWLETNIIIKRKNHDTKNKKVA